MYQTSTSKGQELVAQRMVRDFNALGNKAYLITSVFHDGIEVIPSESLRKSKGYVFVDDPELEIPIIRVDSYIVKWPRRRISFRDFVQILEKIVDEFGLNVLITHSTLWNGPEEVAKFVAWRQYMRDFGGYKDPIVFCHMSHFQEPSPKRYSLVERTYRMAWNRFSLSQILKTANLVLVVTPLEKDAKIKMGADPRKCYLFPSGINEKLFLQFATTDSRDFFRRHRIPAHAKNVSYLGTIEERKNPLGVLKVATILKDRHDIHFIIAGREDSNYADKVKDEASRLPNVTYIGEINDKEKILLIKSSFINMLMSQSEALGLTQLEFMYAGVPVVTSAVGGQSWLVRNDREGIHIDGPEDTAGAAIAILSLADNQDLWNRLSLNARGRARNFLSSEIIGQLDEALTKEMIRNNGLKQIPSEALQTLAEPEHVLKTWSSGNWGAVATDRRLFVKKGRISKKIAEIPYKNIAYIEHTRRYPWKLLLAGFLPTLILLLEPLLRTILKDTFISAIEELLGSVAMAIPIFSSVQTVLILFSLVPLLSGLGAFALQARIGFNLYTSTIKPVYLPHKFSEVVTFVRKVHDRQGRAKQMETVRKNKSPTSARVQLVAQQMFPDFDALGHMVNKDEQAGEN
jgi:glycosyltransferase involved in cell wall biosynthesis